MRGARELLNRCVAALVVGPAAVAGCSIAPAPERAAVRASAAPDTGSPAVAPTRSVPAPAGSPSTGWQVTVYYTAVEALHHGPAVRVTGCRQLDCQHGTADLGAYPGDFVTAVRDEGAGVTRGGRYLNWSADSGFWLDSAPRDAYGDRLRPYVTAAADPGVLARGTRFRLAACGPQDDGTQPPAQVCAALQQAHWVIADQFTPGLGGPRHVDLYLGRETGPHFTDSDWYLTLIHATLAINGR